MDTGAELVSFDGDATEGTVRVVDELESRGITLGVDDGVTLQSAITDLFVFPVDDAVSLTTTELRIDPIPAVLLRDGDGDHLGEFTSDPRDFERGTYFIELDGKNKVYVRIHDAAFTAYYSSSDIETASVVVEFEREATVSVGARSVHSRPQTTLEVPDDPAAVAEAVSYLGSSIKEFSSERSWPTLRGHPPAIRPGDELDIPSWLSKPDTGVTIEVPAEYEYVYTVAPLAFYLGATVEIGDDPGLHLDNGYSEPLETSTEPLSARVESVLTRAFFFDTLVRNGGYYSLPRREYDLVASQLPFYPPNLYGEPISDQLIEYLDVDPSVLDGHRPAWGCRATLRPRVEDAALLSPLANELAPIRVARDSDSSTPAAPTEPAIPEVGVATTTADVPPGAMRLLHEAFAGQREREMPTPADTTLAFVLGDDRRADTLRAALEATRQPRVHEATTVVDGTTADALANVLDADPDFLYYEPPPDEAGERSETALRDANTTDSWPAFVGFGRPLSHATQTALAEGGTVAGLTADERLSPVGVVRLAATLAIGHTLPWSAKLADLDSSYRFFGSPTAPLVRRADGMWPTVVEVQSVSLDEHVVDVAHPVMRTEELGAVGRVADESVNNVYYLAGTSAPEADTHTTADVVEQLEIDGQKVCLNGDIYHGEREATPELVRRSARRALEDDAA